VQPFAAADYTEQLTRLTRAGQLALDHYSLSDADLQSVAYVNNAVFKVSIGSRDGNSYALRLHRPGHKRLEWIRSEILWLSEIHKHTPLCVPQPLMTTSGEPFALVPVDGLNESVTAVLFGWLDGQFYANDAISLESVQQAGQFLARLHLYAADFRPPSDFTRPRLDWDGLFGANSPYNPGDGEKIFTAEQKAVFADVEQRVRSVMDEIGQQPDTFGMIHADFIAKNWLFNENRMCVIDFDDCAWGYYLYDLAPALLQFKYEPRYRTLREAYLGGYTNQRPLSSRDELHLETFIAARHLASCRWLAGNLQNPRIRERAPDLIAQRTAELRRFLETGSIDEGGRKEFF
jgi:Ser/Thr protein kinase RdoA (MazF antagonist)